MNRIYCMKNVAHVCLYGAVWGLLLVSATQFVGCSDEEEGTGAGGGQSCRDDNDCAADEWCSIEFGIDDTGECEPLDPFATPDDGLLGGSNTGRTTDDTSTDGGNCLSDTECPRGFECSGGRCVELGSNTSNTTTNNGTTGSNNGTTDTTIGPTTPTGGCSADAECNPSEECCSDGVCRLRGMCGGNTDPVPGGACGSSAECVPSEECCNNGFCQVRGTCGGNTSGPTPNGPCASSADCIASQECCSDGFCSNRGTCGGGGGDAAQCAPACNQMTLCTDQICPTTVIDYDACVQICSEDPATFGAELVLSLSCPELNESFCADPNFPASCSCSGTGGGTATFGSCAWIFECFDGCAENDDICLQSCYDSANFIAQLYYDTLSDCARLFCAPDYTNECIETQCAFELDTCFNDN
ncbi:MAG: hypothetical protein AAFX99_21330 [Myxococcota bacterium]